MSGITPDSEQEPYEGKLHVRICAGGCRRRQSLPRFYPKSNWKSILRRMCLALPQLELRVNSPPSDQTRQAYDRMAAAQDRFATPIRKEDLENPLAVVDACGWLGERIDGRRVLCLAAGGGRQSALYAAAGAEVTVVDISPEMLRLDRQVAAEHRLDVRTVEASMDDLSMLPRGGFDIVIQPVSTCYVPEIGIVYEQVASVLAAGGTYISQHKQPTSLQVADRPTAEGYVLREPYYRTGALSQSDKPSRLRETGTLEYLHRWEQIVGLMCRAGFVIEDLLEPCHAQPDAAIGTFGYRGQFVAPYVRIKARRLGEQQHVLIKT